MHEQFVGVFNNMKQLYTYSYEEALPMAGVCAWSPPGVHCGSILFLDSFWLAFEVKEFSQPLACCLKSIMKEEDVRSADGKRDGKTWICALLLWCASRDAHSYRYSHIGNARLATLATYLPFQHRATTPPPKGRLLCCSGWRRQRSALEALQISCSECECNPPMPCNQAFENGPSDDKALSDLLSPMTCESPRCSSTMSSNVCGK